MLNFTKTKVVYEGEVVEVSPSISFARLRNIDDAILYENSLRKKDNNSCFFIDSDFENSLSRPSDIHFMKKDSSIEYEVKTFLTLPYYGNGISEKEAKKKLQEINELYLHDGYYEATTCSKERMNYPNGNLNPDIIFCGEAPGWRDDTSVFHTSVYSYGSTSMLFRILSQIMFGDKIWYTNVFKGAIPNNAKLKGDVTQEAIKALTKEIEILGAKKIVCLGNYVFTLLSEYVTIPLYKIYHPAYIFKNGNNMRMYAKNMSEVFNG